MNLPKFSVRNPITTIMMMLLVVILGVVSVSNLKLDLMPNINPPVLAVITNYPGAGPEEVKEMVTKPVEETVSTTPGLKSLQSSSRDNTSLVILQYDWGMDVSEAREDITSKLNQLNLHKDIGQPMIVKFDPTMLPVMQLAVASGQSLEEIQTIVNHELVPQLQTIEGVASVTVAGGFNEEVLIHLNQDKLNQTNLTQEKITQLIQANNLTYPGGVLTQDNKELNLRVIGKEDSIDTLRQLPISMIPEGNAVNVVTLADVAKVEMVKKDINSIAHTNGKESLMISIQKEGTSNTVEVTKEVGVVIDSFKQDYKAMEFTVSADQGEIIGQSIGNVSSSLLFGGAFAIIMILLFLRSVGSTIIIAIGIPFSVIATFAMMYFSGLTLNIMSLGGLALGVGMLVDNAIVVIENIYRHISLNKTRITAAIDGTVEVAGAITSSTLTTVAVFLPIVFIGGLVGDLFKELALTVTFSLLASLAVALTVIPSLAGMLIKVKTVKQTKENKIYKNVITWALDHRLVTVVLSLALLIGSVFLIPRIGTEFIPAQDEGIFKIDVSLPQGSNLSSTLKVVEEIETIAMNVTDVEIVTAVVGNANPLMNSGGNETASLNITLIDSDSRTKPTDKVMNDLKDKLSSTISKEVHLDFNLSNSMAAMSGQTSAAEILVAGPNAAQVKEYVAELSTRLKTIKEVTAISDSMEVGKKEYQFIVDKEKALKNGLTTHQIATFVNQSIQGQVATKLSNSGVEKDVRVKVEGLNNSKQAIENLKITSPLGTKIALKDLGAVVEGQSPTTISRDNQQDATTIYANFENTDMGTISGKIQTEIDTMIQDLSINETMYPIKMVGGTEMMNDAFGSLTLAMILSVVFVYMIMASQFGSLIHPLIILVTLPLAMIGVTGALLLTGQTFGITAFMGIIILVGIVVNNAIVFIDYANKLIKENLPVRAALIKAGTTRLRPILMTALTTMLGLLPLAVGLGEGTEIQAPMAIAVIGGLLSSTVLTLIVVPVVYSLLESLKGIRKRIKLVMHTLKEVEAEMITAK
ncbi:MAG TPA: hypothetical protein DEF42_17530 [Desulfosporosinus sp.]|nr:hypothetical protein [Desulfosporosinus sp.]